MSVHRQELQKVPYLNQAAIDDRPIMLQPLWDGNRWRTWVPGRDGTLCELKNPVFAQGRYYGKEPADPAYDVHFQFLELITKRANFQDIAPVSTAIENDICNIAAIIWKLDHFFDMKEDPVVGPQYLVVTEIEYFLIVCRSLLDLLQVVIAKLWSRTALLDKSLQKQQLPDTSFAKVALKGEQPRTAAELTAKYGLPTPLAGFYAETARFFAALRDARDAIVHHGKCSSLVFRTEKGFAVRIHDQPFSSLVTWDENQVHQNGLGSVRFLVADVARRTLTTCDRFAASWAKTIALPPDIAPEHYVFLRGFYTPTLNRLAAVCEDHWLGFAPGGSATSPLAD